MVHLDRIQQQDILDYENEVLVPVEGRPLRIHYDCGYLDVFLMAWGRPGAVTLLPQDAQNYLRELGVAIPPADYVGDLQFPNHRLLVGYALSEDETINLVREISDVFLEAKT